MYIKRRIEYVTEYLMKRVEEETGVLPRNRSKCLHNDAGVKEMGICYKVVFNCREDKALFKNCWGTKIPKDSILAISHEGVDALGHAYLLIELDWSAKYSRAQFDCEDLEVRECVNSQGISLKLIPASVEDDLSSLKDRVYTKGFIHFNIPVDKSDFGSVYNY